MKAYQTVLKERVETMRLPAPPRIVIQPNVMHKHVTDYITTREYQFEAMQLYMTI